MLGDDPRAWRTWCKPSLPRARHRIFDAGELQPGNLADHGIARHSDLARDFGAGKSRIKADLEPLDTVSRPRLAGCDHIRYLECVQKSALEVERTHAPFRSE